MDGAYFIKNEQKLGIKSNFFLFDPNPNVKNYLRPLLEKKKVQYFNLAIDNSNSNKKFYLNNWFEPSGSSLVSIMKDDNIWKLRKTFMQILQPFKRIKDFSEIDVQTQTLDNFCLSQKIENIDVLKIDTEGNEVNVLKGAKKTIKNQIFFRCRFWYHFWSVFHGFFVVFSSPRGSKIVNNDLFEGVLDKSEKP